MKMAGFGGKIMDSFIDKYAQRRNAQEIIRANSAAEAEENQRLNGQIEEYETVLQEIKKANYQNVENANKVRDLLVASIRKIEELQSAPKQEVQAQLNPEALENLSNDMASAMSEQEEKMERMLEQQKADLEELLAQQKQSIDELLKASDEFNHKESVKVYRNVQAVIEEELPKQTTQITEAVSDEIDSIKLGKGILPVGIITMILVLADIAFNVLAYMGLLPF